MTNATFQQDFAAYLHFDREQWQQFRQNTPMTLSEPDLATLRGQNDPVSLSEVEQIYLPLSRLISLYVEARQQLYRASSDFLGSPEPKVPYIIGVAGSVAVGKSTTSRLLQALLSRWPHHPKVSVVSTDAFLYSTAYLEQHDLLNRKGFPESYDLAKLIAFLQDVKSGKKQVTAPVYSHHSYDIVPDQHISVEQPDILIVEGLNILQTGRVQPGVQPQLFVSDFFDFTVFVDADTQVIKQWFVERVLHFCDGPFKDPSNYFHSLSKMTHEEIIKFAERVWSEINETNLLENILPFRERAGLILYKGENHVVEKVLLRKI